MALWRLLILCKVLVVWAQRVPEELLRSPCPGVFEYQYDNTGTLLGGIFVPAPGMDDDKVVLDLRMSVGNNVQGFNGHITVATPSSEVIPDILDGKPIRYRVLFPFWRKYPPRVTKIAVNGAQICYGSPIEKHLVDHLTTVTLQHTLTVNIPADMKSRLKRPGQLPPAKQPPNSFTGQIGVNPYNPFLSQNQGWNSFIGSGQNTNNHNYDQSSGPDVSVFYFDGENNKRKKNDGGAFLNVGNVNRGNNQGVNSFPNNNHNNQGVFNPSGNPFVGMFNRTSGGGINPFLNVFGNHSDKRNPGFDAKVGGGTSTKQPPDETCGVVSKINTLILGGSTLGAGDHPWLGALFRQQDGGLQFSCGSTLVSKRHVVTAAHCIQTNTKRYTAAELWVVLGRTNIQQWSYHDGAQIIQAESTHVHPDYRFSNADADLAVVTLGEEAVFSSLIRPACVWSGPTSLKAIVGKNGIVAGWGKDESDAVTLSAPKEISLPVVSEEDCLRSNVAFGILTSNRTFCAGYKNNSGPCNGDSGGGFFMAVNGRTMLRGVVSLSLVDEHKKCNLREYAMFTDVAQHLRWLWAAIR